MTIENIKEIMDGVDIAALLPDLNKILEKLVYARFLVLVGPVVLLFLGLFYFLMSPKEANFTFGYRFRWGMGSVQAWQFMQKLAGGVWMLMGMALLIAMTNAMDGLEQMELIPLLWEVSRLLGIQAICAITGCGLINLVVFIRYDHKGKRRLSWWELYKR